LEVELIREYRTRVVTDVVTGKLDVREAAAALPDGASDEVADPRDELDDDEDLAEVDLEEFDEVTA
jgi:type I restriction enzyme S subunit